MWGADDTVVVLATDIAFKLDGGVIETFSHFFDQHRCRLVGEVEEGIEVEVAVAAVAVNG